MGVDTVGSALPKAANPFDYSTIADVLVTIEYTALDSPLRAQVIRDSTRTSPPSASSACATSSRTSGSTFTTRPRRAARHVRFPTGRADFPPNLDQLTIGNGALDAAPAAGAAPFEVTVESLRLTPRAAAPG